MRKIKNLSFLALLLSISILGCLGNGSDQQGINIVEIELDRLVDLEETAWIQIDNLKLVHTPHDFEWNSSALTENDGIYNGFVPTSTVYFYHPQDNEKRVQERMNHFSIIKSIARKVIAFDKENQQYLIHHGASLDAGGLLTLKRSDNREIKVTYSDNYPLRYKSYSISESE